MTKIKVSELTEEKLAECTARAQRWWWNKNGTITGYFANVWVMPNGSTIPVNDYRPDINGAQAIELMKIFAICVNVQFTGEWIADICANDLNKVEGIGETPEIAICRAVVAAVYGEYVEEP